MYQNSWEGKRCAFLGDSITEGVGATKGALYMDFLEDMLGIVPFNYGVNGNRIHQCYENAQQMFKDHGTNLDAIFVFAGTNNYNASYPLGDWYSIHPTELVLDLETKEKGIRNKREFICDETTVRGSLNLLLGYLKHNYPEADIILMTPIHRAYAYFGTQNIQYDESYPNALGLYLEDYVKVIREAADIYSVHLIDLYRDSGLFPTDPVYSRYFHLADTDMLHPNSEGHRRLAKTIANRLLAI